MPPDPPVAEQPRSATVRRESMRGPKGSGPQSRLVRSILLIAGILVLGSGGAFLLASGRGEKALRSSQKPIHDGSLASASEPRVQVVKPQRGGMERTTDQPGTVRAFAGTRRV